MRDHATTEERLEVLRGQDVRTRSCAALVFSFHAGLRQPSFVPPASRAAKSRIERRRMPRIAPPSVSEPEEETEEAPARTAYEILKWVGMIAAIAAPWVLLLSG